MRGILLTAAFLGMGYLGGGALAHSNHGSPLSATHAWARATMSIAKTGAAYLTLVNRGKEADRLIAAFSTNSSRVEFHIGRMTDGVMSMERVDAIEVPAGKSTVLKPGGTHLMLFGLTEPLRKGDEFSLMLKFEHAGSVPAMVTVLGPGAMGPAN